MKNLLRLFALSLTALLVICCTTRQEASSNTDSTSEKTILTSPTGKLDTAIFAGGCFWCTEAVFERLKGIGEVISGYSGGKKHNPTYREVSSGNTGYAEATLMIYDPTIISYRTLVEIFFDAHHPTQANGQGNDIGPQYRAAIFYRNETQRKIAEEVRTALETSGKYDQPIVTAIEKFTSFYPAEDYHQDYYKTHPDNPYMKAVSAPKVEKIEKKYGDKLKGEKSDRKRF